MRNERFVAIALAFALAASAAPTAVFAQQSTSIAGTAESQAKKPYSDWKVRARDVKAGTVSPSVTLGSDGKFSLTGLTTSNYAVELLNKDNKVVCTEGPFDLSKQAIKSDVVIDCGKIPAAWWLVGAGAAAGITAGVVALSTTSPSR